MEGRYNLRPRTSSTTQLSSCSHNVPPAGTSPSSDIHCLRQALLSAEEHNMELAIENAALKQQHSSHTDQMQQRELHAAKLELQKTLEAAKETQDLLKKKEGLILENHRECHCSEAINLSRENFTSVQLSSCLRTNFNEAQVQRSGEAESICIERRSTVFLEASSPRRRDQPLGEQVLRRVKTALGGDPGMALTFSVEAISKRILGSIRSLERELSSLRESLITQREETDLWVNKSKEVKTALEEETQRGALEPAAGLE
ncbi:golgin subfamily A member 6-like protein 6 [Lates japonicus]|uniref:Golgin subfamily A member 6-like protein 6 n=1 Tax=Lates japonicus TaxID=270547 RepID=A0AAD3MQN8_LATJO|nr:golgin subfamily A member 6-like protein 6 [Lates japonicus]